MGIKDWFGGDKKKDEFREKAKELVGKGKLTPGKAAELAKLSKEHGVDDAGDDKTMLRRDVYNKAVASAKSGGKLTESETAELAKIQKFLALRDDQVEKTKWDLARFRTLTEIRQGKLPVVASSNAALRGIKFDAGETPHYCVQVEIFDSPTVSGMPGVQVKWRAPYTVNSATGHSIPAGSGKSLGEGALLVTGKRLILKSERSTAAVQYTPEANIYLYGDGLRLERTIGHTLLKFKTSSRDTAEVIGELLAALMR